MNNTTEIQSKPQALHYFAADGNYGDAACLVILDTTDWTPDHWDYFDNHVPESERHVMAERIALGYGSIDQQDCPGILDDDETPCEWSGWVYRHFEYPTQGPDGGYTWTCPQCQSEHIYEGEA